MEICCLFPSRMPDTVAPLAVTSPPYALLPFALWLHAESQTNVVFRAVVLSRKFSLLFAVLAAAQFIIFMAYLLNQGLKKRTFREEETEEKWQSTLAERDASYGRMVVTAGAPAGSLSGSAGSSAAGNVPSGDIYGSSIRATARVAYPTVRVG